MDKGRQVTARKDLFEDLPEGLKIKVRVVSFLDELYFNSWHEAGNISSSQVKGLLYF